MDLSAINFAIGAIIWGAGCFVLGALVYRNNAKKLEQARNDAMEMAGHYFDKLEQAQAKIRELKKKLGID